MLKIIPSILAPNKAVFTEQILTVQNSVDMVQIDIADGKFTPDVTWAEPDEVEQILKINCELHLMAKGPAVIASLWKAAPQVKRVLFHYEAVKDVKFTIEQLRGLRDWDVGIALNPDTQIEVVNEYAKDIKALMLMGVIPGKQGQKYIPETTERLKKAKKMYPNLFLEIDGGINDKTLPEIIATGVDAIAPGSMVFKNNKTPAENIEEIMAIVKQLTIKK